MPTIAVDKAKLYEELGRDYSRQDFDQLCFDYGECILCWFERVRLTGTSLRRPGTRRRRVLDVVMSGPKLRDSRQLIRNALS